MFAIESSGLLGHVIPPLKDLLPFSKAPGSGTRCSNLTLGAFSTDPKEMKQSGGLRDEDVKVPSRAPKLENNPNRSNGATNGHNQSQERCQLRKEGGLGDPLWQNSRASAGGRFHGWQKSLSDAIRTIRTRASVSANAQEIAQALEAPVSRKLIVSNSAPFPYALAKTCIVPLSCLVYLFCSHQYVLEIYLKRFPESYNAYTYTIRFSVITMSLHVVAGQYISKSSECYSSFTTWYTVSYLRDHHDNSTAGGLSNRGSSSHLHGHFQNSAFPCTYNKGTLSIVYRLRVSGYL